VHACVSVIASYRERRRVTLDTVCRVGETVVIDGHALVMTTSSNRRLSAAAEFRRCLRLAKIEQLRLLEPGRKRANVPTRD
jgi:hypothetical protein